MSRVIRRHELNKVRARKAKLDELRVRYAATKGIADREKIIEKVGKIAPWLSKDAFLNLPADNKTA
ncbi:MAG: hypothetical protein A2666_01405 [Parcubacteria group bacterium RIFCSPHIGHO2_01_FULL_47_10b]|nr:MAG: hypothetical protein A2666_01405 [Parcubacteria group bacterium RIFCSPHIGHO2_01_FULL_47_10b]